MKIYKITHWVRRTGPDKLEELMEALWIKAECLEIDGDVEKGTNTENRTGKVCHLQTVKKADRPSEKKRDLQCAL